MFAKKDKNVDQAPANTDVTPEQDAPIQDQISDSEKPIIEPEQEEPTDSENKKSVDTKVPLKKKYKFESNLDERKEYTISFKGKDKKVSGNVANALIKKGIAKLVK